MAFVWTVFIFVTLIHSNYCGNGTRGRRHFYNYNIKPSFYTPYPSRDASQGIQVNHNYSPTQEDIPPHRDTSQEIEENYKIVLTPINDPPNQNSVEVTHSTFNYSLPEGHNYANQDSVEVTQSDFVYSPPRGNNYENQNSVEVTQPNFIYSPPKRHNYANQIQDSVEVTQPSFLYSPPSGQNYRNQNPVQGIQPNFNYSPSQGQTFSPNQNAVQGSYNYSSPQKYSYRNRGIVQGIPPSYKYSPPQGHRYPNRDNLQGIPPNYNYLPGQEHFNAPKPIYCINQENIPHQNVIDRSWLQTPRLFYLTMGSRWGYSELAKIHLGRPPTSELELDRMCPVQLYRNDSIHYSGYGTQFQSRCVKAPEDTGTVCVNTVGDKGTLTNRYSPFRYYVVQTDGYSYALVYRCIKKRFADYALLSTRPVISQKIKTLAVRQVVQMGFPEEEVRFLTCKP